MDQELMQLEFETPTGSPLPFRLIERRQDGDLAELEIEVDRPGWARILAEGLFGDIAAGGWGFGNDEDVTKGVHILLVPADPSRTGAHEPLSRVLDASRWKAVEVWQPLDLPPEFAGTGARLSTGFRVGGSSSTPLFDVVRRWLDDNELQASRVAGQTAVRLDGDGANGSWVLWIETHEDEGLCIVTSTWPTAVSAERRAAVMELITRVNADVVVGAFLLDLDSGALSFRTSIDITDDRLSDALLGRLVGANVEEFDEVLPALDRVLAGEDPLTAMG